MHAQTTEWVHFLKQYPESWRPGRDLYYSVLLYQHVRVCTPTEAVSEEAAAEQNLQRYLVYKNP